ncbi:hypothetical protein N7508_003635 [Penicillium antarcticum]|uniref:uncharacterized protein n=1 Tax=Penicillium antarcticum TaxID=416450 RepID=UPI0023A7671B|nr:uncharacterized protein N7508_003635 [Penicillium antarcticum]KAJ5312805.1 hypothetical protein N7508_003635 [Penicillium antarcticum]
MASQPLFEIRDIPGKGKGAIALEDIKGGTLILSESILCMTPRIWEGCSREERQSGFANQLRGLNQDQMQAFFDLQNRYSEDGLIEGIMKTNGICSESDANTAGIFLLCSRFNHSCLANAVYSWNTTNSYKTIYAVKNIPQGEEITVSYLANEEWMSSRDSAVVRYLCTPDSPIAVLLVMHPVKKS